MLSSLKAEDIETVIELARTLNSKHSNKNPLGIDALAADFEAMKSYFADREPLQNFIAGLSEKAQAELAAVMWIGRGPEDASDFAVATSHAKTLRDDLPRYIAEKAPALPTYLSKGWQKIEAAS